MPPLKEFNDQFDYVFVRGEGNKGASYKYTWKPDWRMPPGVKFSRVVLGTAVALGLAAIPVYVVPYFKGPVPAEEQQRMDHYAVAKQKNREERMRWIKSDGMPYK